MNLFYIYFVICGQSKMELKRIYADKMNKSIKMTGLVLLQETTKFGL